MGFFVILQNDKSVMALPTEHPTRLNADTAATEALKAHTLLIDVAEAKLGTPATKAIICQVMASAEANVVITDRK